MRLIIHNTDVTQAVSELNWSGNYQSCAREVQAELITTPISGQIPSVRCNIMDNVALYDDNNKKVFDGKIWTRNKTSKGGTISITCFDKGFYLKRNKAYYKFSKSTAEKIAKRVCKDYGIAVGSLAKPSTKISRNFLGVDLYSVIMTAYTLAGEKSNKKYSIVFRNNKLYVEERGTKDNTFRIAAGVNLMDSTVTESAEATVTRVKIYSQKDKFVKNIDDKQAVKIYGVLQEVYKRSKGDNGEKKAKKILTDNPLERKITVNSLGDARCINGISLVVEEPYTGLKGLFYIDNDMHTWKKGQYYNRLVLNFRNIMDEKEAGAKK